jgi:hypothetical protein
MEKDVAEKSRIMIALVIIFVKYYFSLITRQTLIFVRKILQREENKGVELTVSIGNGLQVGLISLNETKKKKNAPALRITKGTALPLYVGGRLPTRPCLMVEELPPAYRRVS